MNVNSPVQLHRHDDYPALGFSALIKFWLGRMIFTCLNLTYHLYELICKTQRVASPIIHDSNDSQVESPKNKKKINAEASSIDKSGKKIPSPIPEEVFDEISDEEDEEDDNSQPIVKGLFQNMHLGSLKEALAEGVFYDLKGNKQENLDLAALKGAYQVQWHIPTNESNESQDFCTLIYRGNFEEGLFNGPGAFRTQDSDGIVRVILDGCFNQGAFISGIMVMDDCYIDGNFLNGEKQGTGTIHYLDLQVEYRGKFSKGKPNGPGKEVKIESDGVRLLAEGEYKDGVLIKGCSLRENALFEGEWSGNVFTGKIRPYVEQYEYEGQCVDDLFDGKGQLEAIDSFEYESLELTSSEDMEDETEEELTLVKKTGFVKYLAKGTFSKGQFIEGQQSINWQDGKKGTADFEKGKVVKSEIMTPEGIKYVGNFDRYTLNGDGTIYNEEGVEVYTGKITCGYPHGEGCRKGEQIEQGFFEWGNFVGEKKVEDEKAELSRSA